MDLLQVTGAENRLTQLGCITKASPQVVDMSRHSIRRVDNRSEVDAMYSIVVYDPIDIDINCVWKMWRLCYI